MQYIEQLGPDNRDLSMFPGEYGLPYLGKTVEIVKDTLGYCNYPVSYTHLTLPTNREV